MLIKRIVPGEPFPGTPAEWQQDRESETAANAGHDKASKPTGISKYTSMMDFIIEKGKLVRKKEESLREG